jgi:hypothetical protein
MIYIVFTLLTLIWAFLYWALWRDRNNAYRHWFEFRDRNHALQYKCFTLQEENKHLKAVLLQTGFKLWERKAFCAGRPRTGSGSKSTRDDSFVLVLDDSGHTPTPASRPPRTAPVARFLQNLWADVPEYI